MFKRKLLISVTLLTLGLTTIAIGFKWQQKKVPKTYEELLAWPIDRLDQLDIARMNLLCATGLPGAEDLDVEEALETIDS